jgi:hypothetical protein
MLLLTAALVTACFLLGQGILALCGASRWRWWAPSLGYAVLLIVGGQSVRIHPGLAMALVAVLITVATLALPMVRRAVVEAAPEAVPIGVGLILLAAIPFFATGHSGVLGATWSNDMSSHLTAAFYLRTGDGLRPAAAVGGDLISTGYPLGSHGLAALLTSLSGLGEEQSFAALTLAVPVLTAFAALGIVPSAPRAARWALAGIIGLGYLPAAYLAQGSFKEITEALFVLATALAVGDLVRDEPPRGLRRGVPVGLLVGGAVYTYSYGGALWMIGLACVFLLAEVARRPRALASIVRRTAIPALGAMIVAAIVLAPEIGRIEAFTSSIFGGEPTTNHGDLLAAVNPLEAVGVWFSGDFRFNPQPEWPSLALGAIGLAVLVGGVVWWWRRREIALPAATLASLVIWIDLALTRNTYNAAKGLVVLAPLVMACIGGPLAAAWGTRSRLPRTRRALVAARALGMVLVSAAAVSTLGQLRSAPVGLGQHEQELAAIRPLVRGAPVLFLANDDFAQWELRGARLYVTGRLYVPGQLGGHPQKFGGLPPDVDDYESSDLNQMAYVITPAASYQSELPPNFRLAARTPSYALYRRLGPTPVREPLEPAGQPGAVFDCGSAQGKEYLAQYHWAGVLPPAVVSSDWRGSIGVPGRTARVRIHLPAGAWDVSLQYLSFTDLAVRAPDLRKTIPPNYGTIAAYWPAGTVISRGRAFTLTIAARKRTWFGQLLGSPRPANSPDSPARTPIWHVAFTRHGATVQRMPANQACGRYVDWFAPAGSTMR